MFLCLNLTTRVRWWFRSCFRGLTVKMKLFQNLITLVFKLQHFCHFSERWCSHRVVLTRGVCVYLGVVELWAECGLVACRSKYVFSHRLHTVSLSLLKAAVHNLIWKRPDSQQLLTHPLFFSLSLSLTLSVATAITACCQ